MFKELPEGYYLKNFLEITTFAKTCYNDLLSTEEQQFLNDFYALSENAQKLYVRMLTRKGTLFRLDKLQYQEISDKEQATNELAIVGFVERSPKLALDDLCALFNKSEWLQILDTHYADIVKDKKLKQAKRTELDDAIIAIGDTDKIYPYLTSEIIQLEKSAVFDTFKLLFFGNLYQDLTEFVVRDLGVYKYVDYQIDASTRLFESRQQIEDHLTFYAFTEDLDEALDDKSEILKMFNSLPNPSNPDKLLQRRLGRTVLKLARQLERHEALEDALSLYHTTSLPPSRERQARIHAKQENIEKALAICDTILEAPTNDEENVFAQEFSYRIAKKAKLKRPQPPRYSPPEETIEIPQSDVSVEMSAAQYFSAYGQCLYVENALFSSLFGLHYWHVIFAEKRGAFTHPFQYRPHDLYEIDFFSNRQDILHERTNINITDQAQELHETWERHYGCANPFVFWEALDKDIIDLALKTIPEADWQAIFARLQSDVKNNRSGFPDLVLFDEAGSYNLIEIKGPGDRLQKNQLRWMQYFDQHNIPHKVVNVVWQ